MIKNIVSASPEIYVSGGYSNMPYISPGAMSAGQVRYNPSFQCIEAYDGVTWHQIGTTQAEIRLDPSVQNLLKWVADFRTEYEAEKRLRESNQAVKNAWEQYQVIKTLTQDKENA